MHFLMDLVIDIFARLFGEAVVDRLFGDGQGMRFGCLLALFVLVVLAIVLFFLMK